MGFLSSIKSMFGSKEKSSRIIGELQLEVVRKGFAANQQEKQMKWPVFENVAANLNLVNKLVFSGWGDPLGHPRFPEMLEKAAEKVRFIEIITAGNKLDVKSIEKIIECSVDNLTIDLFHPSCSLDDIADKLKMLIKMKKKLPKVTVSFTMTSENISELPSVVEKAGALKVDEFALKNIDLITSRELNNLKVYEFLPEEKRGDVLMEGKAKAKPEYEEILNKAEKTADRVRIYFNPASLVANENVMCYHSPLKNAFITWEGNLTPCPIMALEGVNYYFDDREYELKPLYFGNISSAGLSELWQQPEYREFRNKYANRVEVFNRYMEETFEGEPTADLISTNYRQLDNLLKENRLPEPCTKCNKAYGV